MRNEVVEVFATEEEIQKHFEAEVRALHPMLRDSGPNEDRVPALPGSREVPALSPQKLVALNVLSPSQVDRICADQTNTKFLVEDFLPLNSMAIFAGESTIGKSPLLYQLGICVASGQPFLGMHCEQGRVLYFDMENSILDCQTMRNSMLQPLGLKEAPMDFLVVLEPRSDVDQLLDELRPRLVVIDSLRAFRPDVTEKNNKAGEWLKEIRNFSRKYGACFVIVHHLRKPSQDRVSATNLGSCKVVTWLEDMEGPRAFVNQTDVRVAIEEGDGKPAALRMKWAIRVRGDSPVFSIERLFDGEDEPAGYRLLTGPHLLSEDTKRVFRRLGKEFSTGDVKAARRAEELGDSSDPTNKYLAECKQLKLVERLGKGRWRKLQDEPVD